MKQKIKVGLLKLESCGGCFERIFTMNLLPKLLKVADIIEISKGEEETDIVLIEGQAFTKASSDLFDKATSRTKKVIYFGSCSVDSEKIRGVTPIKKEAVKDSVFFAGCPPSENELKVLFSSFIDEKDWHLILFNVCVGCGFKEIPCLLLDDIKCEGHDTIGDCEVLCPALKKPCYGCRTSLKKYGKDV